MKKLPRLTINKQQPKQVHYKKYENGTWVDGGFTSGGSALGTEVWINDDTNCTEAASTLYHEVVHTDQPDSMPGSQREYDAYVKEEQWRIKKKLPPGGSNYRKTVQDPAGSSKTIEVPDKMPLKQMLTPI